MKGRNIEFGIFLVCLGVIWTLVSFGYINWSIVDSLFKLWPLILVVIGINVLFRGNAIVRTVVWLIFLVCLILYGQFFGTKYDAGNTSTDRHIVIEKLSETKNGELMLKLGATKIELDAATGNLLDADVSNSGINDSIRYENGNETAIVDLERTKAFSPFHTDISADCRLHLDKDIVWDMDVGAGAVKGDFDMSQLKVRRLNLDTGAGKFKIIFGKQYNSTEVNINAGASSFDLVVPKDSGVRVKMDGALNKTNLNDLGWQRNGNYYMSPNYESNANKIDINVDMGVGKFNIDLE